MKTRVISAAVMIPIVVLAIIFGGIVFEALVLLISVAGVYEMTSALKKADIKPLYILNYLFAVVASVAVYFGGDDLLFKSFVLFAVLACCLCVAVPKFDVKSAIATVFVMLYPTVMIAIVSVTEQYGRVYIIAGILASVITDTAAYFAGRAFGKRKLCPDISPNKTVAGAVGGALATLVLLSLGGILYNVFKNGSIGPVEAVAWIILAALCGIFAQFGDLFASLVKRFCGIKDYSNLIPGHGGILDRTDSVVFTVLLVYLFKSVGII